MAAFGTLCKDGNKALGARVPETMATMASTTPRQLPLARRAFASLSLGASAVGLGAQALIDRPFGTWALLGVSAVVAAGAFGLSRRGVLAQVLSRGVAWVVLTPTLFSLAETLHGGRLPSGAEAFFAATSAGALLLARPALHTPEARAEFAPLAYRRAFLAGAVASATAGLVAGTAAVADPSIGLAALAFALLASAVGVARMRSWGVLLGVVSSMACLAAALVVHDVFGVVGLALAAMPGLMLGATVTAARVRAVAPGEPPAAPVRVPSLDVAPVPARARVAIRVEDEPEPATVPAAVRGYAGE